MFYGKQFQCKEQTIIRDLEFHTKLIVAELNQNAVTLMEAKGLGRWFLSPYPGRVFS